MITYQQLWAADPAAWRRAGSAWRRLLGMFDRRIAELTQTAAGLRTAWSGSAGRSAHLAVDALHIRLDAGRSACIEVDQVLAEFAATLAQAKAMLNAAVTTAAAAEVLVYRDGSVSPRPGRERLDARAVHDIAAVINAALDRATAADRETALRLSDLAAAAVAGWPAEEPATRPETGADPVTVRHWWAGLTPAQRRWLVRHEPELIGRLDGVPVADRDQANRLLLAAERAALLHQQARLLTSPRLPHFLFESRRISGALAGLDALAARLDADTGPRAYLLGLDPAGDGRAIVAVGNPDHADNVLTYVPGMTADLAKVGGELGRVERMATRCTELGPTEQTAAVLWLDYDAPDFVNEAMHTSYAQQAGAALHRFQEGLRATHTGDPAHQTVLGHSYGSLVVGATARDHGLAADSLVFVGSPGVGVEHARDLGVPPSQVWSTTARDDVIQYAALSPGEALRRFAIGAALPGVSATLPFGSPSQELWFGPNPSGPGFGAQVFDGDPRGHIGYWHTDNPALDSMARIILGSPHQPAR